MFCAGSRPDKFHNLSPLLTMAQCFLGCNAECLGKLTTGSEEKTMFNGQVLEPLVLLVEVINIMPLP